MTDPTPPPVPSRRRRTRWLSGLLLLTVGSSLYFGLTAEWRSPPASGHGLPHPAHNGLKPPQTLRIATFNIHGGKGIDGTRDLQRTGVSLNGDYDLMFLQETHRRAPWLRPQVQQLADELRCGWMFAPTEQCWWGEHFGSALLSTLPIGNWQQIPWPRQQGGGYRHALLFDVPLQSGNVHVLATHIDSTGDREMQLRSAIALFHALAEPKIFLGDLNSLPDDPQLNNLRKTPGLIDCVLQHSPTHRPQQLDWIFVQGLECKEAGVIETEASDHPIVWAELTIECQSAKGVRHE